ncbi:MAG: lysophospholipase [Lachnospiraceae bacterium]|nr:lysophospholipase [Lachnospiraceae bacterium]
MIDFFGEDDYAEQMKEVVLPFLEENDREGYFDGVGGMRLHYHSIINPDEKAAVVISHGFCEFFQKYHEMTYYFYQSGYSVFFIEHRGHGYSGREIDDMHKVHCTDFFNYVEDLKCFMDQVVSRESQTGRYLLYCHSMGGCIGALFMERYPDYFRAGVLSSPMMRLNFRGVNPVAVRVLLVWSIIARWDKKFLPTQHDFDFINTYPKCSAQSQARHNYLFEYRLHDEHYYNNGGTYKWARESFKGMKAAIADAGRIQVPVILFQAGQDTMVEPGGQEAFLKNNPAIEKKYYPDSKHEIFNAYDADRMDYYNTIISFYEKYDG